MMGKLLDATIKKLAEIPLRGLYKLAIRLFGRPCH